MNLYPLLDTWLRIVSIDILNYCTFGVTHCRQNIATLG
nr:MAG TPA: hypothetical protein [Caudoviricetes sp.]